MHVTWQSLLPMSSSSRATWQVCCCYCKHKPLLLISYILSLVEKSNDVPCFFAAAQVTSLRSRLASLEQRLAAAEEREAQLMLESREAETLAAERDDLEAQVAALRSHLEGSRTERAQLEHYKQVQGV